MIRENITDYFTKVILEPFQSILGERKTPEEIIESLDYDIVED